MNFLAINGRSLQVRCSLDAAAAAVLLGMIPLLLLPTLPSCGVLCLLGVGVLLLLWLPHRHGGVLVVMLSSFIWANVNAKWCLQPIKYASTAPTSVVARVVGVNIGHRPRGYPMRVVALAGRSLPYWRQFVVHANWPRQPPLLQAGQLWQLSLTLRPVHAQLNEGGVDGQRWAVAQRQLLSGTVRRAALLDSRHTLRQRLINRVCPQVEKLPSAGLLLALAFGERGRLTDSHRRWLQQSGTAHLMAISGLHISLAALFGWGSLRLLQRCLPLQALRPALPLVAGWLFASLYVWLAGANPPALRAWLALSFLLWLRLRGYYWRPSQLLLRITALLLLYDPLFMLSSSIWLSCSAVAILLFWRHWVPLPGCFRRIHWRILLSGLYWQGGILLLLLPLQVTLFHGIALWSLPANLVAIPLVSLCTVPLLLIALLTCCWPALSQFFWHLADFSLLPWLEELLFKRLPHSWWSLPAVAQGLSYLGWVLVMVWRLGLWRTNSMALLVLLLVLAVPLLPEHMTSWKVDLLDIGHGLAVVISRRGQAMLYDVGNSWPGGSIAQRAIFPYLNWHRLQLTGVILSHQDRDHAGSWPIIQQHHPHVEWRSAAKQPGSLPCRAGERWWWQGLYFEVLWPPNLVERAYNKDSCTLRISDGRHQMLLTGDLEKAAEWRLVQTRPEQLAATALLVPHHGSLTSSSLALLAAVKPQVAVVSVARYNAWRLPSKAIRERYRQLGIAWYSTARDGQLSLRFNKTGWQLLTYRHHLVPRWYHQWWGTMLPD